MRLEALLKALKVISFSGDPNVEVKAVSYDSRNVGPGSLFAAVRGLTADGRGFVSSAVQAGAAAVLADSPLELDPGVPVIIVPEAREAMALAAAEIYGRPSADMTLVGITGTNGKTTTAYLLESILTLAGLPAGVLGTVNFRFNGHARPAAMTTPEGPDLQKLLGEMRDSGIGHVVMEVSSHALDLSRVAGCLFDAAVFTNLSQDHLDYHRTMSEYFEAKRRLFTEHLNGNRLSGGPKAVINVDDEWGRILVEEVGPKALTFSLKGRADLTASRIRANRTGLSACLETPAGGIDIHSKLLGGLNLYNFLAAAGAAMVLGLDTGQIAAGIEAASIVPGRLEKVGGNKDYLVLVDYAHSEDALDKVLEAARALGPKRLITVFGCGGDRDRGKRPLMGMASGRLSDLSVVTSDNPRTEDPMTIIGQIENGLVSLHKVRRDPEQINSSFSSGSYVVVPDRRSAIRLACRLMLPGDILVIAGKGQEDYQILGRDRVHFDDREEARSALETEGKL